MDDLPPSRPPSASFGPDRRLTLLCGAGVMGGLVLTITWPDAPGRLLFGLATVVLAVYVLTDLVFSPRLVVDARGLIVHTPFTRGRWTWAEIQRVQADVRQRHGLRSVTLEIDAGDDLVVLTRRALGEQPDVVAEVVAAFTPPSSRYGPHGPHT